MGDDKVTTGIASEQSFSLSMGSETEYETNENRPIEANEGDEDDVSSVSTDSGNNEDETSGDPDESNTQDEDTDVEDSEDDEQSSPEDLGEFDPEDTERWDAQYKTEDGYLNEDALANEFWSNATDDERDSLNEGTYAYLESIGISKAMAKNVEAALVTQQDASKKEVSEGDGALFTLAGELAGSPEAGADVLQAALEWGKGGGYSKDAQKKFNEATKGSDAEAKTEAVELLVTRYLRANPDATPKTAQKERPRTPQRDGTKGRGKPGGGLQPFKSRAEARQARSDAGDNQAARRLVAQRIAISNFTD